jgi:3'-phosphoadenosine 5'-phosphosulfate sulfotransferase (PAPS reductase)/FAD synthetase
VTARISFPPDLEGLPVVASVSGGKDSTALTLALTKAGIEHRRVFADTGWEAPETYAYLEMLRGRLGPIDVVRARPKGDSPDTGSPMVDRIRHRAGFPARMQRWCTRELKIEPLRRYHDALGVETVSVVGVRADESKARSTLAEVDDDPEWGGFIWRPLLTWTVADVLDAHRRHGVPVNPLYQRGHDRVGCYPCIFARKDEVRLVADHAPGRIEQIAELEAEVVAIRQARNEERPGRYQHPEGSFFQTTLPGSRNGFVPIGRVVEWSRTARGGRQTQLLAPPPSGGCFRWGLCERPADDGEQS